MNALPKASRRHVLVAAGLATVLVGGGAGVALAAGTTSGSATPSATPPSSSSSSSSSGSAAKPPAPKPRSPHLDGTVTALASATITIKDHEGFTRTIRTSSATKYADGLTAALKTGTEIDAVGTVDKDTTSLDATTIGTHPTPPTGADGHGPGRGGPGHFGPGNRGPGQGGPDKNGGTRPRGAPSATATPKPPAGTPAPSAS
jgi:hypothetical protein